ncbi:MAG TPA: hypothetical protein VD963_06280 [Phycisphaerales bacterium]|nr:hypothetical protein [Phycisphaerales bacterium]
MQRKNESQNQMGPGVSRDELAGGVPDGTPDESGAGRGDFGSRTPEELGAQMAATRGQQGGSVSDIEGERGAMPGRAPAPNSEEAPPSEAELRETEMGRTSGRATRAARDDVGDGNRAGGGLGREGSRH